MPWLRNHKLSPRTKINSFNLARFKTLSKILNNTELSKLFGISKSHVVMMKLGYRVLKTKRVLRKRNPHSNRIFTEKQIKKIRKDFTNGVSQFKLSRKYNVSQPTIWDIVHRRTYKTF